MPPFVHGPDVQRFGIRNLLGLEDPQPNVPCVPKGRDREDKEGSVMLTDEDKQWIIEALAVSCASPADGRQRTRESIIELRLTDLEQRVTYLEIRMRPHPEDK
jgi:hypothetical protein